MATELWRYSATDLAAKIRAQEITSLDVIEAHLARIEAVNPAVNAVTVVLADTARESAVAADEAIAAGEDVGPLHGVPMTIKENVDLAGSPTTQGVPALAGAVPLQDAPSIAHLKSAGAIPIGRTNMPDFGLRWHTDNDLRGPTKNPWGPSRTPGGSSGGEAAALALGMTPLGNGNDLGGSVRWPSQCCGVAALRPTLGRVASASDLAAADTPIGFQLMAVQGPMARHVKDLRLALGIMSQPDARDPWWTPAPLQGPDSAQPLRVALAVDPGGAGTDPRVTEGVRSAGRALAEAGYEVEEVDPPAVLGLQENWQQLVLDEINEFFRPAMEPVVSKGAMQFVNLWTQVTESLDHGTYMRGYGTRKSMAREWSLFQEQYPLVVGPVSAQQPFKVGYDVAGPDEVAVHITAMRLTIAVNDLGLPSVALPVGTADVDGVEFPQGVQIIGQRYREDRCLDAAEAVEAHLGQVAPIDPRG